MLLLAASFLWLGVPLVLALHLLLLAVYRRFFHPLAKVPGPLLPAITPLYRTYYNGTYFFEIDRMHRKYALYVTLGSLFRRFENLKMFETTAADVEFEDFFSAYYLAGKKWFKAIAKQ